MRYALALVAVLCVSPAMAGPPRALYQQWLRANEGCRGGLGSEESTMAACQRRNAIDDKMQAAGWCFGQMKGGTPLMDWSRCHR